MLKFILDSLVKSLNSKRGVFHYRLHCSYFIWVPSVHTSLPYEFWEVCWDWGKLGIPNLGRMSLMMICYWMLQNARVTGFTIPELLRKNQQEDGGGGITLHHTQIRVKICQKSFLKSLWKRSILLQSCRLQEFFKWYEDDLGH